MRLVQSMTSSVAVTVAAILILSHLPARAEEGNQMSVAAIAKPQDVPTEQDVRTALRKCCLENTELHGAWLVRWHPYDIDGTGAIGFKVTAVVDSAQAKRQLELLRTQLETCGLSSAPKIERVVELPLSTLLAEVREQIRAQTGDAGCLVGGVVFGPDPRDAGGTDPDAILEVVPYGRAISTAEKAAIIEIFRQKIGASPVWQQFQKDQQIQVVVVDKHLLQQAYDGEICQDWLKVKQRIQNDRMLSNAWVELAKCVDYSGRFQHYDLYVRAETGEPQIDESYINKLVTGCIDRDLRVVEVANSTLPNLLRLVNLFLAASSRTDGCYLEGAEVILKEAGGEVRCCLVLRGQVAEEKQRQLVSSAVGKVMASQTSWKRQIEREDFLTLVEKLEETPSSSSGGKQLYALALVEYRKGRYADAADLFRRAVIASPNNLGWRYWHIVALMQQGNEVDALDHMRAVLKRTAGARDRAEIARSLEKVQGSVRQRLMTLEREAMTTSAKTQ